MTSAWMLRCDGEAFPCTAHPYTTPSTIQGDSLDDLANEMNSIAETVQACKFISHAGYASEDRELALKYMAAWYKLCEYMDPSVTNFQEAQTLLPGMIWNDNDTGDETIDSCFHRASRYFDDADPLDIPQMDMDLHFALNQYFLRARHGGLYNSTGIPEMVFRVSSVEFSWNDVITEFLDRIISSSDPTYEIQTVTVCKDSEGSRLDMQGIFYLDRNGRQISNYPIQDFLNPEYISADIYLPVYDKHVSTPRTVITAMFANLLAEGKSRTYIWHHMPMNWNRFLQRYWTVQRQEAARLLPERHRKAQKD